MPPESSIDAPENGDGHGPVAPRLLPDGGTEAANEQSADDIAVRALAALAHAHRLNIYRYLVQQGPDGIAAGEIARRVGLAPSNLSFHISQLQTAGLVTARRRGRVINYAVHVQAMRDMLIFLTDDCCNGHPDICAGLGSSKPDGGI